MTAFEEWWATTAFTKMDGPVPPAVARLAWDAAKSHSAKQLIDLFKDPLKEIPDEA